MSTDVVKYLEKAYDWSSLLYFVPQKINITAYFIFVDFNHYFPDSLELYF